MYTTTNRAGTIRVEMTDEQWAAYVSQYGTRAREMVLTLAGQCVTHRERERIPVEYPTHAQIEQAYITHCGDVALLDRYGNSGLQRRMAGGMLSDGALAAIASGEKQARIEIERDGVPAEFAQRERAEVDRIRAFETRCAHRTDMTVIEL